MGIPQQPQPRVRLRHFGYIIPDNAPVPEWAEILATLEWSDMLPVARRPAIWRYAFAHPEWRAALEATEALAKLNHAAESSLLRQLQVRDAVSAWVLATTPMVAPPADGRRP